MFSLWKFFQLCTYNTFTFLYMCYISLKMSLVISDLVQSCFTPSLPSIIVQARLMALETWNWGGEWGELRVGWGAILLKWLHCGALKKGG